MVHSKRLCASLNLCDRLSLNSGEVLYVGYEQTG